MQSASSFRYLQNLPAPPQGAVICVDLDGTLVRSDTLFETITPLLHRNPINWIASLFQLFRGRAAVKSYVASHGSPQAETLAWREELIEALQLWKAQGHTLVLATASHLATAEAVQAHLGLFDHVLGTEEGINLRGHAKLAAIKEIAQERPLWYLGDSSADIPLWKEIGGVAIAPLPGVARKVRKMPGVQVVEESRPSAWVIWSRALRLPHWVKNLLLFLPAALSLQLSHPDIRWTLLIAFLSFSLASSATYLINDLLDLACDRKHPIKKHRPLAAGWISPVHVFVAAPLLLSASAGLAWTLHSSQFTIILLLYLLLTTLYSISLKKIVAVDLLLLTSLYILRLYAGAVVSNSPVSLWLVAFSFFFFASLLILRQVTDLQRVKKNQIRVLTRRAYITDDLPILRSLGIGAGFQAAIIPALLLASTSSLSSFSAHHYLWLLLPVILFWTVRMWIINEQGEMLEDPILFAIKDRWSWMIALVVVVVMGLAAEVKLPAWLEQIWR